jgi:hypothetical protein
MLVVLAVALGLVLILVAYKARSRATVACDTTPAFDQVLRDVLEELLASRVLGFANSTEHERASLRRTLAGEPDPEVVAKIEELVRSVDLEFVRDASDAVEVTVRVRYENGHLATRSQRLPLAEAPEAVLSELQASTTRAVSRTWSFPWHAATAA